MPTLSTADQPEDAPVSGEGAPTVPAPGAAPRDANEAQGAAGAPGGAAPGGAEIAAGAAAAEPGSLERMARLRRRVREEGADAETAARELGVDPIIAQLWLRLPDDLWPASRAGSATTDAGAAATGGGRLVATPPPAMPRGGLRRVLTCRVPAPAIERLRATEGTIAEAAAQALAAGLAQSRPPVSPGGWRFPRRPLAVPIPAETYQGVLDLAEAQFRGDPRDAAGWLIARGAGIPLPLPTEEELDGRDRTAAALPAARPVAGPVRFIVPPRRRPEARAPLPADDSAPSGEELRRRREASGLSQRDLAAASGLSRGLVAEIERGRRRHVLTRLKLSDTLAAVERNKAAAAPAP